MATTDKGVRRLVKQRYRARHKTYCLNFSLEEAKELERLASKRNLRIPSYIKAFLNASQNHSGYVVPNEETLQALILEIRAIGTNINQLVRYIHTYRVMEYSDIEKLNNRLSSLEYCITTALSHPPAVTDILEQHLAQHPEKRAELCAWVRRYEEE